MRSSILDSFIPAAARSAACYPSIPNHREWKRRLKTAFDINIDVRINTHMRINTHSNSDEEFSRRERQIMDIIYAGEEVTAREIWERLPSAPTYSTVRTLLGILEGKGYIIRRAKGRAFVYRPKQKRETAALGALRRIIATFFQGSVEQAVSGLLEIEDQNLSDAELARIARLINHARKERKS